VSVDKDLTPTVTMCVCC